MLNVGDVVYVPFSGEDKRFRPTMQHMRTGRIIGRTRYYVVVLVRGRSGARWRECYDPAEVAASAEEYAQLVNGASREQWGVYSTWKESELALARQMYEAGASYAEIAKVVGRSANAVKSKLRKWRRSNGR